MYLFSPALCLHAVGSFSLSLSLHLPPCACDGAFISSLGASWWSHWDLGLGGSRKAHSSLECALFLLIPALPEILPLGIGHWAPLGPLRSKWCLVCNWYCILCNYFSGTQGEAMGLLEQVSDSCALTEFHQKFLFLLTALSSPVCQVAGTWALQNIDNVPQVIEGGHHPTDQNCQFSISSKIPSC